MVESQEEMLYESCILCPYYRLIPRGILPRGSCPRCGSRITYKETREFSRDIQNGIKPIITHDIGFDDKKRTFVNSENFPWFPYDGFRVLKNNIIYEWKKKWWIFGQWREFTRNEDEIYVLDEAVVR